MSAYLVRRFSLYLGLRLELNGYDKISRSKARALYYIGPTGINGTEGRDRGRQEAPNVYRGMGERRKFPHQGLGRSPRNRRNFEHLIPNGVHFGLLFASQFSKVGGDGRRSQARSQAVRKLGGTRPTGPIGRLRLCIRAMSDMSLPSDLMRMILAVH